MEELESILATSVGNVAFDYIGHSVYSNDSNYPELKRCNTKNSNSFACRAGTLAELAGGDFSQSCN